ncbi:MAG: hypothetical protein RR831_15765, partial [Stenotrophomonas sp.]
MPLDARIPILPLCRSGLYRPDAETSGGNRDTSSRTRPKDRSSAGHEKRAMQVIDGARLIDHSAARDIIHAWRGSMCRPRSAAG